ncbi:hypothetical protein [Aestuariivirga sp.]|uniref:hypothetical protein n=1 Tax=Aestuariivirga sp. TaxID=2650926 RepID=UPI00359345E4
MAAAMLMAAMSFGSVLVDHFDKRNNETDYRRFVGITSWAGYGAFGMSLLWFVMQGIRGGAA